MALKPSSIADAYGVLGLEDVCRFHTDLPLFLTSS